MADNELANRLQKRIAVEEGKDVEKKMKDYRDPHEEFAHPYPEFSEFSREQCAMYEDMFAEYDENKDDFLCYDELKAMMEKRGEPLTHMELKKLISTLDEDQDGKFNFREFMLMWSKCLKGEMPEGSGFTKIVATNEIVLAKPASADKAGVGGAATFFETKARAPDDKQNLDDEIVSEQRKKYEQKRQAKRDKEAAAAKKAAFANRASMFNN
ncbi:EF-hand domain-containing protein D2-like [Acanthaster planci]|uniref:EF-hand domain-containing protein D2-like n=1 Tax=Acanthaster planci TaxID=133434 RepID=A0A8B7YCC5_ACAPL|nr:EF-hand domain-containing protein D2-like [Acanthaster planci]